MKRNKNVKRFMVACAIFGVIGPVFAIAQPDTLDQPVYSSSSEAMEAQQIAQQGANATNTSLDKSLDKIQGLETQLNHMQNFGNSHQIMTAKQALNNAENMYMNQLSTMTGVSMGELGNMHDAGNSYGAMAKELGVQVHSGQMTEQVSSPMNSGQGMDAGHDAASAGMNASQHNQQGLTGAVGSSMDDRSGEIMGATSRNTESGWSEGHATGMQTGGGQDDDGGMMAGGGGLNNGMGSADSNEHDGGGMGGGMGASGSESSGSEGSGGMGGSSGGDSGGGHGGGGGGGSGM